MPLVLSENEDTESGIRYEDRTGVSYQFPKMYRRLVLEGEPFVYYRGRKKKGGGRQLQVYFGTGVIGAVQSDPNDPKRLRCDIHDYQPFSAPVSFKRGNSDYLESSGTRRGYFQRGVRSIPEVEFAAILNVAGLPYGKSEADLGKTSEEHLPAKGPNIFAIARELNSRAHTYAIGELQNIRAKLKGFSRRPGSAIFSSQTIHEHWAFHHGGRSELQFNIGVEKLSSDHELRHGIAFSFELSQALPAIDVLIPKARLFNDYMQLYPEHYADMRMWHYSEGVRSTDYPPAAIMPQLVTPGTFVFLGARQPFQRFDYGRILEDFDRLLPLYTYVESEGREEGTEPSVGKAFHFVAGCTIAKSAMTTATIAERELDINLKAQRASGCFVPRTDIGVWIGKRRRRTSERFRNKDRRCTSTQR